MAPSRVTDYEEIVAHSLARTLSTKVNDTLALTSIQLDDADKQDLVLKVFRCYIADLCEQFKGGHPGYPSTSLHFIEPADKLSSAMGMAAIGIALYKYVMKYSPRNASYFNRDRFVLSNG
jgi:dihydroxyacetone synthase